MVDFLVDLEDKPAPELVFLILPGGVDALPEVVDGADDPCVTLNLEPGLERTYFETVLTIGFDS